jgi:hypothetical protein
MLGERHGVDATRKLAELFDGDGQVGLGSVEERPAYHRSATLPGLQPLDP